MNDLPERPIAIPYNSLSSAVLREIIKEFVLREGTDYGSQEYTIDQKIASVLKQLETGVAGIFYEQESETCTIRMNE